MNKEIYNTLKNRIIHLDCEPETILKEQELAAEFGVSRTPLRTVLFRLELELVIGAMAFARMSSDQIQRFKKLETECSALKSEKAPKKLSSIDMENKQIFHQAADNPFLAKMSEHLYALTYRLWSFALLSSADEKNRYNEINPDIDKRTCGYHRRQEAVTKSTAHLVPMVEKALDKGVRAKHVLMDSWFSMPSVIADLREHIHVICMLKDHPKWCYEYQGKKLSCPTSMGNRRKNEDEQSSKPKRLLLFPTASRQKLFLFLVIKNLADWHFCRQICPSLMKKSFVCTANAGISKSFSKCASNT
ncbi:hypothetical protein DO021_17085 [Desulfobacter hydrogenophilus]|uniref:GntR family transcriptional regulator n=1 Tax=Desulfobacter hydrogenophilus TaxID=2291 RepID=A0A328F7X2_9BACT|nr:GntR family transcriptional regulator [Desulfobacter hydrogenophilus]NDY74027.1 GntR family transcriptional regulator [Desulfobacter hydrogenophilus]QBH15304.1 GntR family transcriptional regulator [Desulfobacter hydrogenophilus]RAM00774.1 hypothetical protein DO021_17085 [Desulfobacter hydrogenophilus]